MRPLTIAVPKGRILSQLAPVLARAGLDPSVLAAQDRRLMRADAARDVQYLLLKPGDVPPTWSTARRTSAWSVATCCWSANTTCTLRSTSASGAAA